MKTHYSLRGYPLFKNDYRKFHLYWWLFYINPKNYYLTVKYFLQRGWRGYASCDHWDADGYFETVAIGVLKDLREHAHGYPAGLVNDDSEESDKGMEIWRSILTEIIDGLEASRELKAEDTIPPEVYPNTNHRFEPSEDHPDLMEFKSDGPGFNAELYEQWAAPLRKKKRRAFVLLAKYWQNLWD